MLENISLIASIISALTAFTTSLRALGKSRENLRSDIASNITTGCRPGNFKTNRSFGQSNSMLTYVVSTIIWLVLAVVFAIPPFFQKETAGFNAGPVFFIIPFLLLLIIICFIWWKALCMKNTD